MGTRGESLATAFEQANDELIAEVSKLDDAQWHSICEGEGWTAGVTAHHLVASRDAVMSLVQLLSTSPGKVEFTPEMLNAGNAAHAEEAADIGRDETLTQARASGKQAADALRAMDDEALGQGAEMFGRQMTAAAMVEGALIGHIHGHLESIRAATAS